MQCSAGADTAPPPTAQSGRYLGGVYRTTLQGWPAPPHVSVCYPSIFIPPHEVARGGGGGSGGTGLGEAKAEAAELACAQ